MDSLLQLSDIACQAERLTEEKTISSNSSESSSQSSSSSSSSTPENVVVPQLPKDALAPRSFSCSSQIRSVSNDSIQGSDRSAILEKIKTAYRKKAHTFDELLELSSIITEDQVFQSAPSKLDYYKNGIRCVKTIFDKTNELNAPQVLNKIEEDAPKGVKRAKTQH